MLDATQKLQLLVPAAADDQLAEPIRALAAVLLRRTFSNNWEESWLVLSAEQKEELKEMNMNYQKLER